MLHMLICSEWSVHVGPSLHSGLIGISFVPRFSLGMLFNMLPHRFKDMGGHRMEKQELYRDVTDSDR